MVEKARAPAMATLLVSVAVAVLAAYALDFVLALEKSEWNRWFSIGLAVFGLGVLIVGSILFARRADVMNGGNYFLLTGIYAAMLAVWLAAASHGRLSRNWAAFCPIALVVIELTKGPSSTWRNQMDHSRPNILEPLAEDYKIAQFLHSERGQWRAETDVPYSFGDWWGIETIDGLVAAATSNVIDQDFFSPRFREFMSVRFRVADKPSRPEQRVVFEGPRGLKVFENPTWMPRAWMVHEVVVEPNAQAMSGRLTSDNFDPRRQVLLRAQPAAKLENCPGSGSVEVGRRTPNRVELKADTPCTGMLILNDVYYPGWRVSIDGKSQPIYEADGVVRGVVVDKGRHTVVFEFSPWSVKLGVLLSLLGLAGTIFTSRRIRDQDGVNYS